LISAFLMGFFLGLSLIIAIGAQNTFVLRQGILGHHIFYVAIFCALADTFLIIAGIAGLSFFLNSFINQFSNYLYGFSSIWLASYGFLRLKSAFKSDKTIKIEASKSMELFPTLSILAILTFANPHVYLDTVVLIGSISQQFHGVDKISFALGAALSSFIFFFSLAYGAKLLAPKMQNPTSWRVLDVLIALIMFIIAINLASYSNWF